MDEYFGSAGYAIAVTAASITASSAAPMDSSVKVVLTNASVVSACTRATKSGVGRDVGRGVGGGEGIGVGSTVGAGVGNGVGF